MKPEWSRELLQFLQGRGANLYRTEAWTPRAKRLVAAAVRDLRYGSEGARCQAACVSFLLPERAFEVLRFSANLGMLFSEKPFLERFAAAAQAGFSGVEFPFPYAHSALDLAELCQQNNQQVVLFNLPPGDLEKGDRGLACDPQRRGEFQDSVGTALDYAEALQCRQLNCLAGVLPSGVSSSVASQTLVDNLHFAGVQLKRRGLTLLTEPINPIDIPGFFLNRTEPALALIEQVGLSNLRLQCDMYHMQVMGEDLATTIEAQIERIGHFQIADFPGRHEPGTGRMDYTRLLKLIENLDYSGWIGCEYHPEYDTVLGLAWMEAFR